jgi:hypothetical protein
MAQIQAGVTYVDGGQVTAVNLNAHVNNAVLVPGAITSQVAASSCTTSDSLLIVQAGSLKQATLSQVQTAINPSLDPYLPKNGSQPMTGLLTLANATLTSGLNATPKSYVDSGLATKQNNLGFTPVNKAGDTNVGALSLNGALTLPQNPQNPLEAATKQYVDSGLAGKQANLGFTPLNKAGDIATGDILVNGPLANPAAMVPKSYVDTNLANGLAGKQNVLGFTPLNKAGDTATGDILLAGPLSSASAAVPKNYVDSGLAGKQANLGYTPVNKAGDTNVGAMTFAGAVTLPAPDPSSNLQATHKQYVDARDATRIPFGGATIGGTYLYTGNLQTSTAATSANDVLNKSFFDSFISTTPKIAASCYFFTAVASAPTVIIETGYLLVNGSRSAGSTTFTVNYDILDPRYENNFFLAGQYIGIKTGTSGITGKLYRIESVNSVAKTFTIITTESTVFSSQIKLTLVFDSTTTSGGYNVKSVYWDNTAVSKYYVNYINDTDSGSPNPSVINPKLCFQLAGSSNLADNNGCFAMAMRNVGRTINNFGQDQPEGFGATSFGAHIGFFYNGSNGQDNGLVLGASFIITHF